MDPWASCARIFWRSLSGKLNGNHSVIRTVSFPSSLICLKTLSLPNRKILDGVRILRQILGTTDPFAAQLDGRSGFAVTRDIAAYSVQHAVGSRRRHVRFRRRRIGRVFINFRALERQRMATATYRIA